MVFFKKMLMAMGAIGTLLSGPTVTANEKLEQKIEEIKPIEKNQNKIKSWNILEADIRTDVSTYFKLPKFINLNLDGSLSGKGFRWKTNDTDFSYNNIRIFDYFKSLENIGNTYMKDLKIGGDTLENFLDIYNSEKDILGDTIVRHISHFKQDILDIYDEQYSEDFIYGLIKSMIKNDVDEYLDKKNVEAWQREETREVVEDFLEDMEYALKDTETDDIIKGVLDYDPFDSITLKEKSLREIIDIAKGFGNLMKTEMTDNRLKARLDIQGKGQAKASMAFSYKARLNDEVKNFTHILDTDLGCFGKANFMLDMRASPGTKLSETLGIDPLTVFLYDLSDIDIRLKDIELESMLKIRSEVYQKMSEAFELSEDLKDGKAGAGIIYLDEKIHQQLAKLNIASKLYSKDFHMDWNYRESWQNVDEELQRNLIYLFAKEDKKDFWYFASLGLEIFSDNYRKIEKKMDKKVLYLDYENQKDVDFLPRINLGLGIKGKEFSPFVVVKSFPYSSVKAGALITLPYVSSKVSMQANLEDERRKRQLIHPFAPKTKFSMETIATLFGDEKQNVKDYLISQEQLAASPLPGKESLDSKELKKLYSTLDNLVLNMKYSGSQGSINTIYCAPSSFFIGGGYFNDFKENLHGVNLIIGYDSLLLKARYGYADKRGHYSHLANLSASGTIKDNFMINLDLRSFLLKNTEARYAGIAYGNDDIQATLNFIGTF